MMEERDKLINDLHYALMLNFDYVPLYKVIDIADRLIAKGWRISQEEKEEDEI